jgi:hypothetical protein
MKKYPNHQIKKVKQDIKSNYINFFLDFHSRFRFDSIEFHVVSRQNIIIVINSIFNYYLLINFFIQQ